MWSAFNSSRWENIINALRERFRIPIYLLRILRSYLKDRKLFNDTPDGRRTEVITSDAIQEYIIGPDLWNLSYNDILDIEMPKDTYLVGYADDRVSVISARDIEDARRKLNQAMIRTQLWLEEHGLEHAKNKTEVILMTMAHIPHEMSMQIGDVSLVTRYLGIRLNCRLNYWAQIHHATAKAPKLSGMLSRLMANIGGPTQTKRKLLMAATNSILGFEP